MDYKFEVSPGKGSYINNNTKTKRLKLEPESKPGNPGDNRLPVLATVLLSLKSTGGIWSDSECRLAPEEKSILSLPSMLGVLEPCAILKWRLSYSGDLKATSNCMSGRLPQCVGGRWS